MASWGNWRRERKGRVRRQSIMGTNENWQDNVLHQIQWNWAAGKKKKRSEAKDNHGHRLNSFPRMNQSELTWSDFLTSLQGLWAFGDRKAAYKCSKAVWVNTSQFGNNDLSSMMKLSMKYGWEYGDDWTSQNCIANVANEIFLDLIPNSWPRAVLFYFCSVLQFLKNACKSQSSA